MSLRSQEDGQNPTALSRVTLQEQHVHGIMHKPKNQQKQQQLEGHSLVRTACPNTQLLHILVSRLVVTP